MRAALREDQVMRYARHVLLPDVGGRGQARLLEATVVVELRSTGAAEIAALAYLAAGGVGRLCLGGDAGGALDRAEIARGILYGVDDVGRPRGQAARDRLRALNPDVEVILGEAAPEALRLSDELEPGEPHIDDGAALADALVRGGAAASRLLVRIARRAP
jgi:molybdopterin/thiamine biosynthesis adenylyltransferase